MKKILKIICGVLIVVSVSLLNYFLFNIVMDFHPKNIWEALVLAYAGICSAFFIFNICSDIYNEIHFRINIPSKKQMEKILNDLIEQEKERLIDGYRRSSL
jgi:hypothetical protein